MIKIVKNESQLLLKYQPYLNDEWIDEKISKNEEINLDKSFCFLKENYLQKNEYGEHTFILGILEGNYYKIKKEVLNTTYDVYIDKEYPINYKMFKVDLKYKNVFSAINDVYNGESLFIGGENADISSDEFQEMINFFPTNYERDLYIKSRIEKTAESYFKTSNNYSEKLRKYLDKKKINCKSSLNTLNKYDIAKYNLILEHLKEMIVNYNEYVEEYWQDEIVKIITLIMPQYIFVLKELNIKLNCNTRKRVDILLINANGNVDIIEVKRYDPKSLIGKNPDSRGNYKPNSNLSSAIVQAEKYSYLCNVYSREVKNEIEKRLNEEYNVNFEVNVLNPKTIIVMGNNNEMTLEQKNDFELIRRMYANVIDIITYGDLVARLENLIKSLTISEEDE